MAAAGAAAADVVFRTPECFPLSLSGLNDSGLNVAYPFALPYLLSICQLLDLKNAKKTVAGPSNFISGMFRFVLFYFFFLVCDLWWPRVWLLLVAVCCKQCFLMRIFSENFAHSCYVLMKGFISILISSWVCFSSRSTWLIFALSPAPPKNFSMVSF